MSSGKTDVPRNRRLRTASADDRGEQILSRIRRIPRGRVLTYGDIDPKAPRLVGRILADTFDDVPWHRVVRADGSLAKGERQRMLLIAEGVPMIGDRVDLRRARVGARR